MTTPERIGRYEIVRQLGEGGMGRVYLAKDTVLGREVAIKVLRDDLGLPPETKKALVDRMRNEARAAATVRHPNLVTLHDMGDTEDGGLFLVFEYVPGPTLREKILLGPMPPLDVARIANELGNALAAAHEAGVIHRDIKPENVILSSTGAVLADFGLARMPDSTLTAHGTVLGTVGYSAPEVLAGKPYGPAADQFSLAATLYEAFSGKRAFPGEDILTVAAHIANDEATPLVEAMTGRSALPTDTDLDYRVRLMLTRADGVLRRALQKEPDLRYPSCRAFCDSLVSAVDVRVSSGFMTLGPTTSIVPKATRRWQNMFVAAALGVIALLVIWGRNETKDSVRTVGSASIVVRPRRNPSPIASHTQVTSDAGDAALPELPP